MNKRAIGEGAAGLALIALINFLFPGTTSSGAAGVPHLFWLVVILTAIRHGSRETFAVAAMSGLTYAILAHAGRPGGFHFSSLRLWEDFGEPALFIMVGGMISELRIHQLGREDALRRRIAKMQTQIASDDVRLRALTESIRLLDERIVNTYASAVDLFRALAMTRKMTAEKIRRDILMVLGRFLRVERAVYYNTNLVPMFVFTRLEETVSISDVPPGEKHPVTDMVLAEALRSGALAHVDQFTEPDGCPTIIAGPITDRTGRVTAIVGIEQLPFTEYNASGLKLFSTILTLWSSALEERSTSDTPHLSVVHA